jgi:flagellar basal body-associated protein FliL
VDNSSTAKQQQIQQAIKAKMLKQRKKMKLLKIIIVVAIVLLLALLGLMLKNRISGGAQIKKNQYQAVFLTNGQVYFGKLQNTSGEYLRMTDVYYLQVQNNQNQQSADNKAQEQTQQTTGQPQLIKLGQELHGPEDELNILRTQISFWENLKDNGKVAQAIKQYKQK